MKRTALIFTLLIAISLACASSATEIDTGSQTDTEASTIDPTDVPSPTDSPPPTQTPDPITLTGSGDSVVDIDKWEGPAITRITGNATGVYFGVVNYGTGGEYYNLLVNATESYNGIRPLDFTPGQKTVRFEITATGDWSIEILPLSAARVLTIPSTIEGTGDEVILLSGTPDLANITGNAANVYFGIVAWGTSYIDLLVNATEPYSGTVIVNANTTMLEISAVGSWSIEITE